jgi:outer membrane lipoprotein-sorting protein
VLDLVPKQASTVQHLFLVVDPASGQVSESVTIDAQDNIDDYLFSNTDLTTPIPAAVFTFNPNTLPNFKVVTVAASAPPSSTPSPSPSPSRSPSPSPSRSPSP